MKSDATTFSDFLHAARRRARPAVATAIAILLAMTTYTFSVPAVYESHATLLIEEPEVEPELVGGAGPSDYAEQRLQRTRQLVLTKENILHLVGQHQLYAEEASKLAESDLIALFNSNVVITPQVTGVVDPRTMRDAEITYAFDVGFLHDTPDITAAVANDLAQLFVRSGGERAKAEAARTIDFLQSEAERLEADLRERDSRLAEFRQTHLGGLPENREQNLARARDLERDIARAEDDLRAARARKELLEAELRDTPRDRPVLDESGQEVLSGAVRLEAAQRELVAALAKYSEDHPDVRRLRREIAALSTSVDPGASSAPTNPAYVQLRTQINAADIEIQQLSGRRNSLATDLRDVQAAVYGSPQYEKQYTDLIRDYELVKQQYEQMRQRQAAAEISAKAATANAGETYVIVDPARVPSAPIEPDRVALMFLGLVLSIAGGLGVIALLNATDQTIRGSADVSAITNSLPLGTIPVMLDDSGKRKKRALDLGLATAALAVVGVVVLLVTR